MATRSQLYCADSSLIGRQVGVMDTEKLDDQVRRTAASAGLLRRSRRRHKVETGMLHEAEGHILGQLNHLIGYYTAHAWLPRLQMQEGVGSFHYILSRLV